MDLLARPVYLHNDRDDEWGLFSTQLIEGGTACATMVSQYIVHGVDRMNIVSTLLQLPPDGHVELNPGTRTERFAYDCSLAMNQVSAAWYFMNPASKNLANVRMVQTKDGPRAGELQLDHVRTLENFMQIRSREVERGLREKEGAGRTGEKRNKNGHLTRPT